MRLILMLVGVALMMVVTLAAGRLGSATEQAMREVLRAELLMIAGSRPGGHCSMPAEWSPKRLRSTARRSTGGVRPPA